MRSSPSAIGELASAYGFPEWFGNNWNALEETLGDLDWMPAIGYGIWILGADELLRAESAAEAESLLLVLDSVTTGWSRPSVVGEPWDRPACPFHVGFQFESEQGYLDHAEIMERIGIEYQVV
jgi:hypothetical protein